MSPYSPLENRIRKRPMSEINVVPYIDVMLVLLVIFMITAPLLTQGVSVKLPEAAAKSMQETKGTPIIVTVDADGNLYMNIGEKTDKPVKESVLKAKVAAVLKLKPKTDVYVRGDTNTDYGKVINAMVLLQQAGVKDVGLVTKSPKRRRR